MRRTTLLTLLLLAATTPALATLGPPLKISREGERTFATAGREYNGTFLVQAGDRLDVELVSLGGEGWSGTDLAGPTLMTLEAGDSVPVDFRATPTGTAGPLVLTYTVEGRPFRRILDPGPETAAKRLDPASYRDPIATAATSRTPTRQNGNIGPKPAPERKVRQASLKTIHDESYDLVSAAKAAPAARTITIEGRVLFREPDQEDPRGARGATVYAYDEDSTYDDFMGADITDEDGYFSITVNWDPCFACDAQPDIYVQVEAANTRIFVQDSDWEYDYNFETPTHSDFTGSNINVGWHGFKDEDLQPVLFMLTHATRAFEMIDEVGGRIQDTVDIQFPSLEGSNFYFTFWEEIHIEQARGFNSGTVVHEYGHHFVENFSEWGSWDTCNDVCDDGSSFFEELVGSCSHCRWCEESQDIAWNEGFPQWLADLYSRYHDDRYGYEPYRDRTFEFVQTCREDSTYHYPVLTEGYFAALLRDLEDSNNESDPNTAPYADGLDLDARVIFDVADYDEPTTGLGFFHAFRARVAPQEPALWETVMNAGWTNYDNVSPGAPVDLISQTHDPGVSTPAKRIYINWDQAPDDASGVDEYAVAFTTGAPARPDTTGLRTSDLFARSDYLPPGTYYACVRARDRAGLWSPQYASYGPLIIREPSDPDITFLPRTGWDELVVPRNLANASDGNVPEPLFLVGNSQATWWNAAVSNVGESMVPAGADMQVFLDGNPFWVLPPATLDDEVEMGSINEAPELMLNRGPLGVGGGRHVFSARADVNGEVIEEDELDNVNGRSWVWSPAPMTEDVDIWRAAPPNLVGGWEDITSGGLYFNCDGLRFTSTGWWNAVTMVPELATANYDLRLHAASTGATDGFYSPLGFSTRPAGRTDAVLVNRNFHGEQDWDVAVWQTTDLVHSATYKARHVTSTSFAYGDSIGVTMGDGEVMTLHEVHVSAGLEGTVEVIVRTDPAQGPLWVSWFDAGFTDGDILDDEAGTRTDEAGFARLQVQAPVANYYCVAVYRDATDGNGVVPETFSLEIGAPSPDIAAYAPSNWTSPLVPWEDTDDLDGPITAPASLPGFEEANIHSATMNLSGTTSPGPYVQTVFLDDRSLGGRLLAGGYAGADSLKDVVTTDVRGGRHTLWMRAEFPDFDSLDALPANNLWAEQWVWSPWQRPADQPYTTAAPPDPTGGWNAFENPAQEEPELFYNCVGFRTPLLQPAGLDGYWTAVVATPVDSLGDIDLRLHDELSTGAKSGFRSAFLTSADGGRGQSEFAIIRQGALSVAQVDIGVIRGAAHDDGTVGFTTAWTASRYLGVDGVTPVGEHGPWDLPADHALAVFDVWLDAGDHTVTLHNLAGGADLGLSIHGNGAMFARDSGDSVSATAWLEPAGADETIPVLATVSGYHAIAVWKAGAPDLPLTAQYSLEITSGGVSGTAPGNAPLATRIEDARPNPFNPRTSVAFTLNRTGHVEVSVYNLKGQRVRVLHEGALPAGRHTRVWDGRDEQGQGVASGTYFVRLRGNDVLDHRKVTLLK